MHGVPARLSGFAFSILLIFGASSQARAYEYRVPILVQDETDIEELYLAGDITEEERDRLLDLQQEPIDLNTASRTALYELPGLTWDMVDIILKERKKAPFRDVSELSRIPGIDDFLLEQIQPFARVAQPTSSGKKDRQVLHGKLRLRGVDQFRDDEGNAPESYLKVEGTYGKGLRFGALVRSENSIAPPTFRSALEGDMPATVWSFDQDGNPRSLDGGLSPSDTEVYDMWLQTTGDQYTVAWPKAYLQADSPGRLNGATFRILAGSYRVGFGQRLVLDNSGRTNPQGFIPDLAIYESLDSFRPFNGFTGLAATMQGLDLGFLTLDTTAFFSWWRYDVYQYDLHHESAELGEGTSESYAVLTPYRSIYYRKLSYQTLPRAMTETLGGANIGLDWGKSLHIGITGYLSTVGFELGDHQTIFANSSKYPNRSSFGAFGSDLALSLDPVQAFAEVAMTDQGDPAAMARLLAELGPVILETSYRYYSSSFDNPHSRGYAMADEYLGDRDKGEQGVLLTARYRPFEHLSLRTDVDLWKADLYDSDHAVTSQAWKAETYARIDVVPLKTLVLGTFLQFDDKNLLSQEEDRDYAADGRKIQWGFQASWRVAASTQLWLYYKIPVYEAGLESGAWQKDHYATLKFSTRPFRSLTLAGRLKYFKGELETLQGDTREHYVEGYLQAGVYLTPKWIVTGRAMLTHFIDDAYEDDIFWKAGVEWTF